jgi:diaminohydroxyphosphoribosylaminopyrimidine deaminase/5-amino-6-(5-phosphoribosylamino)uracil reductase
VGITTVLQDDPLLTARGTRTRADRPVKVIVDSRLRLPSTAQCLSPRSPAPTLIATTVRMSARCAPLARRGAEVLVFRPEQGRVPLRRLCQELVRRGLHSVLIEGGAEVLASAFAERIVNRIVWFVAPTLIGGRQAPSALGGEGIARLADAVRLRQMRVRRIGADLCIEARVAYPPR